MVRKSGPDGPNGFRMEVFAPLHRYGSHKIPFLSVAKACREIAISQKCAGSHQSRHLGRGNLLNKYVPKVGTEKVRIFT